MTMMGFGVSMGVEPLSVDELEMVGVGTDVEVERDDDAAKVLVDLELELVGVDAGTD